MTDGCNKARKEREIAAKLIKEAAIEWGIPEDEIKVFQLDCHDHACNVWWGAVTKLIKRG